MTSAVVRGVGLLGPGLPGWAASRPVLAGEHAWQTGDVALPAPALLPAAERRRAAPATRLALAAAGEAAAASGLPPAAFRLVFASGNGDSTTVVAILETLTRPDGFVSPTHFHNSVHNAPAGYWSIGAGSQRAVTCLGAHDWSFGAGLMAAVADCAAHASPVLLCVYDVQMPHPLHSKRPTSTAFGVALALAPDGEGPRLALAWARAGSDGAPRDPALHALAAGNPAARALRLLEALARGGSDTLDIPLLDGCLRVAVT